MSFRRNIDTLLRKVEKEFTTHNRIEISKSALLHNLDIFEELSRLPAIPVLKGNAYGHDIELVAEALKGRRLPYIAVDGYFEALRIREVSRQPVLIMGAILPKNYASMKYDNFTFVVQDEAGIHGLGRTGKNIKVHLEANTGMNRYGAKPDELAKLTKLVLKYKNLTLEGVMSHLADSDGNDPTTVDTAVNLFDVCVDTILAAGGNPTLFHVAQSAGSLKASSKYANTIRLGIGLYGINPFPKNHHLHSALKKLQPALRFVSTVTKVIELKKGDQVSYNYTYTAPKALRIGIIPVGYYEGVNRALSNTGHVKIGLQYAPIVGRVCMNHTMVNLDGTSAHTGDSVVVYSNDPLDGNSIDAVASAHNLFSYNLLTALNSDVRRVLVS